MIFDLRQLKQNRLHTVEVFLIFFACTQAQSNLKGINDKIHEVFLMEMFCSPVASNIEICLRTILRLRRIQNFQHQIMTYNFFCSIRHRVTTMATILMAITRKQMPTILDL